MISSMEYEEAQKYRVRNGEPSIEMFAKAKLSERIGRGNRRIRNILVKEYPTKKRQRKKQRSDRGRKKYFEY